MSNVHVIFTNYGDQYGWALRSPQIPGLAAGRTKLSDLLREAPAIFRFAQADVDLHDPAVMLHEEHVVEAPDGTEYLVRWMTSGDDRDAEHRAEAASRLEGAAISGFEPDEVARQPVLPTGERLLIGVTGSDQIGMFMDQLGPSGSASLSHHNGNDALLTIPFSDGELGTPGEHYTLDSIGLTRKNTFDDLADRVMSMELSGLVRVTKAPIEKKFARLLTSV